MIIAIEGTICSGKSTVCRYIKNNRDDIVVYEEDIDKDMFERYMNNRDNSDIVQEFQKRIIQDKVDFVNNNKGKTIIFDRYIEGDMCFVDYYRNKGMNIDIDIKYISADVTIFLNTDNSYKRLIDRGNNTEITTYTEEYLNEINNIYRERFKYSHSINVDNLDKDGVIKEVMQMIDMFF